MADTYPLAPDTALAPPNSLPAFEGAWPFHEALSG